MWDEAEREVCEVMGRKCWSAGSLPHSLRFVSAAAAWAARSKIEPLTTHGDVCINNGRGLDIVTTR